MSTALECFRQAHPAEPTLTQRIGLGVPLVFTTVLSFILNILLLIIVLRSSIIDRNFGLHVVSLIVASLVYLMANTLALIPTTVANLHYGDPWNAILSSTDNLGYLALMFTTTNVATDRFVLFFLPKIHRRLTSSRRIFASFASIPWFFSIVITIHMAVEGCYTRTDPYTLTFTYGCSTCVLYGPVLYYFGFIFPGINFVLYSFIYVRIIAMRFHFVSSHSKSPSMALPRRKETVLVFQFSLICALQFASSACFYVLPPLMPNNDLAFHLPMIISTLNTLTNPCVMMIFQHKVRTTYWLMIKRRTIAVTAPTSVVPLSRLSKHSKG